MEHTPPYLGAAYYPEDWPLEQIDDDIALMKQAGLNCVRVAEFAWSTMEPREGEYDFAWLHTVLDKLGDARISVVMCTPTATPPAWLTSKHPDTLYVYEDGTKTTHGARRHYDPCSKVYREYTERIVTRMAQEFGQDERIIGWQIDNELFPSGTWSFAPSFSPECHAAFAEFMRKRFGTIDKLNEAWCASLWSQTYDSFEQIPFPDSRVWHHPALRTAWREFVEQAYLEYLDFQADLLHKYVTQPIGTNMMIVAGLDFWKANRKLDVVQFDRYNYGDSLWHVPFWLDIMRPIKERPFWVMETSTCWSGSAESDVYSERGFCTANSWLSIALGGEMNSYWLWRQHWAGQELMHGSVIQSNGRPFHIFGEVQELSRGFRECSEFLNGTRPDTTGLAIHHSTLAFHMIKAQPMTSGFEYEEFLRSRIYRPLIRNQWRPDLIHPAMDLSPYRVAMSPFLPALDEMGLRERILQWIENGGTWIAGPYTDVRDLNCAKYKDRLYGTLEDWGGVQPKYHIPASTREFGIKWSDGTESTSTTIFDGLETLDAEPIAWYTEYPFEGLAAVTVRKLGKGQVVVLGTLPKPDDIARLLGMIALDAGVEPVADASENLLVVPRSGPAGSGMIVVEMENLPAHVVLPRRMRDMLTGADLVGRLEVEPYRVRVFRD